MKRTAKWLLAAAAAVVVLAIAAVAAVPYLVDTPRVQALIAGSASQALGRPVTFESVSISVLPLPAVELRGLAVAEDPKFGTMPFLKLERGDVRLRLRPLLSGRVEFGEVVLKKPLITVIQDAGGHLNIASLGPAADQKVPPSRPRSGGGGGGAGAGAVLGSRVRIEKGVVTYVMQGATGRASNYRIEDLDLALTPSPGLLGFRGDASVKPGDLSLKLTDGTLALNSARGLMETPVRGRLAISAKDIKDLVAAAAGPTPAMGGGVKGTLTLAGTVGSPRASGDVELSDLAVTQTNPRCQDRKTRTLTLASVKLNVAWEEMQLIARPVSTSLGGGTITTNLVATLDRGVHAQLRDIGIKAVPVEKVVVDFLCQGYAVTGPLDLSGTASAAVRDPWNTLSGSGQLRIGPGKVVGAQALELLGGVARLGGAISSLLAADVPATLFSSPLEFDSITGTYQITNGLLTTRDLLYTSRAMKVTVAGEYALASGRMNLDMLVNHGRGEVQAKVTGTAAAPSIRVVPASVLKSVDPGAVQRGLQDLLKRFR